MSSSKWDKYAVEDTTSKWDKYAEDVPTVELSRPEVLKTQELEQPKYKYYEPLPTESLNGDKMSPVERSLVLGTVKRLQSNPNLAFNEKALDAYYGNLKGSGIDVDKLKQRVSDEYNYQKSNLLQVAQAPLKALEHGVSELKEVDITPQGLATDFAENIGDGQGVAGAAASTVTKPIAKAVGGALGVAGGLVPEGQAFVTTMEGINKLSPESAEALNKVLMPVSGNIPQDSPEWAQNLAIIGDVVIQGAAASLFFKGGKKIKAEDLTPEQIRVAAEEIKDLSPEQVNRVYEAPQNIKVAALRQVKLENDLGKLSEDSPAREPIQNELSKVSEEIDTEYTKHGEEESLNVQEEVAKDLARETRDKLIEEREVVSENSRGAIDEIIGDLEKRYPELKIKEEAPIDKSEAEIIQPETKIEPLSETDKQKISPETEIIETGVSGSALKDENGLNEDANKILGLHDNGVNFDLFDNNKLRQIAKDNGIDLPEGAKNADIIEALKNKRNELANKKSEAKDVNESIGTSDNTETILETAEKKGGIYSQLAKAVKNLLGGVKTIVTDAFKSDVSEHGDYGQNEIRINNKTDKNKLHIFFHEALHHITRGKIEEFESNPNSKNLKPEEVQAILNLKRIFKNVTEKLNQDAGGFGTQKGGQSPTNLWLLDATGNKRGLANVHEFISEAFTNPEFQKLLKDFKGEGKQPNLFKQFVDAVAKMLGLKDPTILDDIFHHTEKLIDKKQAPTQYTEAATPREGVEGVSGSALKDVGRTAKAVSKRVAVEHAGYEGAKRVTGANENTLELDGYGTVSTSQFINTLVENGRLPKDALKNRHIQLTDEYATKLLNENSDLFPKENTETNKTEANLPTFESAKKEYDNVKEKHNKYLKKDGGLRANTPDNVKKEIEDAYTKMQSMVKQERDKRVSEDKRDTGLIDGIERIKDNTSAFTLVRMAMNRGVIPERQFNEFGKNLLHIIADAKDSHEVTMQTAEIIQDFSQRANVKVDDLLAREIQAAENLKYEPVEEVKAPTQYTEAAGSSALKDGGQENVLAEQGKKSLANRVYEGNTPEEIKASVEKNGLTYDIEKQDVAEQNAIAFMEEVGTDNALKAVRNGEVSNAAETFIFGKAIDDVYKEGLLETDPARKQELLTKEAELIKELDERLRSKGRAISAANAVYQTSDLGYKLGSIINRAVEANQGELPKEVVDKLTDLSAKLDEANRKLEELKRSKKDPDLIIKEPVKRQSLSPEKLTRKLELRKKYSGVFNDVTNIPRLIAEKEFREYAGLVLEEMAGDFKAFSTEMINTVGKGIREHLPKLYKDLGGKENPEMARISAGLKKSIAEYERKLKEKDFASKKRGKPELDAETFDLLVERNKLKDKVDLEIEKLKLKNRTTTQKLKDGFVDVLNLPKSLIASADMSAPLRQGAILSFKNPKIAAKSAVEMFRQAFSEDKAVDWLTRLKSSPEYARMKDAGLYFAEPTAKLSAKEEQFISNIAHKIPIWGRVVKGSERAYSGYLNKLRADVFTAFEDALVSEGFKGEQLDTELKSFADFVNNATGRGSLGRFEESTAVLNAAFFSPRYAISRFNLLSPVKYAKMSPRARAEALKSVGTYIGLGSIVLALAKAGGAEVGTDFRSADAGKIKVGDTRFDIWAGFQQWVRLITQVAKGEKVTIGGKTIDLSKEGYGKDSRLDVLGRFARSKASPTAGLLMDVLDGEDMLGNPVTFKFNDLESFAKSKEGQLIIPLYLQDIKKTIDSENKGVAAASIPASFFGVGVQTYSAEEPKTPWEISNKFKGDKEKITQALIDNIKEEKKVQAIDEDGKGKRDAESGKQVMVELTPAQTQALKEAETQAIKDVMERYDSEWTNEEFESEISKEKSLKKKEYLESVNLQDGSESPLIAF